jgi:hypothetical protein
MDQRVLFDTTQTLPRSTSTTTDIPDKHFSFLHPGPQGSARASTTNRGVRASFPFHEFQTRDGSLSEKLSPGDGIDWPPRHRGVLRF